MSYLNNDIYALWNPARVHGCFAKASSVSVLLKATSAPQIYCSFLYCKELLCSFLCFPLLWTGPIEFFQISVGFAHWLSAGERKILPCVMQRLLHFSSGTTLSNAVQWKLISHSCRWSLASCIHEEFLQDISWISEYFIGLPQSHKCFVTHARLRLFTVTSGL